MTTNRMGLEQSAGGFMNNISSDEIQSAMASAKMRAKSWLNEHYLFLDTETTGLGDNAEIVEICIINAAGGIMLNTLIKPTKPIPAEATAIHGITNQMVAYAPTWEDVHGAIRQLFFNYVFVIYNADYDTRLIYQTAKLYGLQDDFFNLLMQRAECAKLLYAEYRGEPGKFKGYEWHKLVDAAEHESITVTGSAHRALTDCRMMLGMINAVAIS